MFNNENLPNSIGINDYMALLENMLISPSVPPIEKDLVLPNFYKFYFTVLDIGNKGFICEHDLFQVMK